MAFPFPVAAYHDTIPSFSPIFAAHLIYDLMFRILIEFLLLLFFP